LIPVLKGLGTEVTIYVPKGTYFSLTNSPYPTHIISSATDIYAKYPYMPCEVGEVVKVIEFKPPRFRTDADGNDYVVLIRVGNHYLKILHVRPSVKVGDVVKLGDYLGDYLISGYFRPWSSKHMHVEVRYLNDPLRALGSVDLVPTNELINYLRGLRPCRDVVRVRVVSDLGSYYLGELISCDYVLAYLSSGCWGVLDGGVPHYSVGGLLLISDEVPSICGGDLLLNELVIGRYLRSYLRRRLVITLFSKGFLIKGVTYGLGTYLLSRYVKLVPLSSGADLRIGEVLSLNEVTEVKVKLPRWFSRLVGKG